VVPKREKKEKKEGKQDDKSTKMLKKHKKHEAASIMLHSLTVIIFTTTKPTEHNVSSN
jgi:hypothetical protein